MMADTIDSTETYGAEIERKEVGETNEWGFKATVWTLLENPNGENVIARSSYSARPKREDITKHEGVVHQYRRYYWVSDDSSYFGDWSRKWTPVSDIDDDDELLAECVKNATRDPEAQIKGVGDQSDDAAQRLGLDDEETNQ